MIDVTCTSCGWRGTALDSDAGKRCRCPQCGSTFTVPNEEDPAEELAKAVAASPALRPVLRDSAEKANNAGSHRAIIIGAAIVSLFAIGALLGFSGVTPSKVPAVKAAIPREPLIDARLEGPQLIVHNRDTRTLRIEAVINDEFEMDARMLEPENELTTGVMNFANKQGLRFNPLQYKVRVIRVTAGSSDGGRKTVSARSGQD